MGRPNQKKSPASRGRFFYLDVIRLTKDQSSFCTKHKSPPSKFCVICLLHFPSLYDIISLSVGEAMANPNKKTERKIEMNIVIFDTETIGLEKCFCYNVGYVIADTSTMPWTPLVKRDFVVEQIWHNAPLFETAYYANKKPLYVSAMRGKCTRLEKWGYITQQMARDFKAFEVESAYAYNSPFDDNVFSFNCDWFKTLNPFDNIPIYDIRGYAHLFIVSDAYKDFCEKNQLFTDSGNYSTTAEAMTKFIRNDLDFEEAHTALSDSEIEMEILENCVMNGAELGADYTAKKSIERKKEILFAVKTKDGKIYNFKCNGYTFSKKNHFVRLK